MPERPSIPAVYDPQRNPNGTLKKGHSLAKGWNTEVSKRFKELRALWFEATSLDDMQRVRQSLVDLALNCENPDVRLKAVIYFCDRMLGKPTEKIEVEATSSAPAEPLDLSAEELATLQKIVRRSSDVVDGEVAG